MQNRLPENAQTGVAQGGTRGDDICDQISHTKLHRGFHRAIQMDGRRIDAMFGQIVMHKLVEGGTHPLAFDVVERGDRAVLRRGETERGSSETEVHLLLRISARVEQQIMAGDTHVDGAHAHVHCDVQWTKVEQFDVVVGVLHHQLAWVAPQRVSGLRQHGPCRLGKHALVWHCDSQHDSSNFLPTLAPHATDAPAGICLQVLVDVVEGDATVDHHDLQMVDELAHLLGSALGTLVFGGDPRSRPPLR